MPSTDSSTVATPSTDETGITSASVSDASQVSAFKIEVGTNPSEYFEKMRQMLTLQTAMEQFVAAKEHFIQACGLLIGQDMAKRLIPICQNMSINDALPAFQQKVEALESFIQPILNTPAAEVRRHILLDHITTLVQCFIQVHSPVSNRPDNPLLSVDLQNIFVNTLTVLNLQLQSYDATVFLKYVEKLYGNFWTQFRHAQNQPQLYHVYLLGFVLSRMGQMCAELHDNEGQSPVLAQLLVVLEAQLNTLAIIYEGVTAQQCLMARETLISSEDLPNLTQTTDAAIAPSGNANTISPHQENGLLSTSNAVMPAAAASIEDSSVSTATFVTMPETNQSSFEKIAGRKTAATIWIDNIPESDPRRPFFIDILKICISCDIELMAVSILKEIEKCALKQDQIELLVKILRALGQDAFTSPLRVGHLKLVENLVRYMTPHVLITEAQYNERAAKLLALMETFPKAFRFEHVDYLLSHATSVALLENFWSAMTTLSDKNNLNEKSLTLLCRAAFSSKNNWTTLVEDMTQPERVAPSTVPRKRKRKNADADLETVQTSTAKKPKRKQKTTALEGWTISHEPIAETLEPASNKTNSAGLNFESADPYAMLARLFTEDTSSAEAADEDMATEQMDATTIFAPSLEEQEDLLSEFTPDRAEGNLAPSPVPPLFDELDLDWDAANPTEGEPLTPTSPDPDYFSHVLDNHVPDPTRTNSAQMTVPIELEQRMNAVTMPVLAISPIASAAVSRRPTRDTWNDWVELEPPPLSDFVTVPYSPAAEPAQIAPTFSATQDSHCAEPAQLATLPQPLPTPKVGGIFKFLTTTVKAARDRLTQQHANSQQVSDIVLPPSVRTSTAKAAREALGKQRTVLHAQQAFNNGANILSPPITVSTVLSERKRFNVK